MIHYDRWHKLTIDENGATLTGHDLCPGYPDGPGEDDTAFGCLTYVNLRGYNGRQFPEVTQLTEGEYLVRYWWTDDRDDGYAVKLP